MRRQSEFKKKYDPITGTFTKQHIYEQEITNAFTSFGSKVRKKKTKKTVTPPAKPSGKPNGKAGDAIVKILSKSDKPKKVTFNKTVQSIPTTSQQDINSRVLRIMSGEKII